MSKRSLYLLPLFLLLSGLVSPTAWPADLPADAFGARLATFDKAAGESYFALSVTPQQRVTAAKVQDVVILVDTSASQTGLFREDSLLAVKTIVQRLDPQDRVKLFAVDLDAVALCDQFVEAGSQEMTETLARLAQRTPLGSTDMVLALQAAVDSWQGVPERPRAVIYVGDGLSRANFFGDEEIKSLVDQLVERRASVSSLAIGPARSIEFLAVMANQTGGVLWLDSNEEASAQMAGTALAKAVQQTVFWPQEAQFSAGIAEFYPSRVPPLRTDRDTILIGKLESNDPQSLTVKAEAQGETVELAWNVAAERSNEDFSFLPKLVDMARDNGGLTLPTVGSAGLREVARMIVAGEQEVSVQERAFQTTPVVHTAHVFHLCSYQAEPQEDAGLEPQDEPQEDLQDEPQEDPAAPAPIDPFAPAPAEPAVEPAPPAEPAPVPPAPQMVEPETPLPAEGESMLSDDDLLSELDPQTRLLDDVQASRQVLAGRMQAEVEQGLNAARRQIATDP
ncbi:MAG: vWA domain-containing protein, partial [Pirellulaceae bacterium]